MRTYLDCYPCFLRQALEAAKLSGANTGVQKKILDKVAVELPKIRMDSCPPESAKIIRDIVKKFVKSGRDPYGAIKQKNIREALKIYPLLKKKIKSAKNKLLFALELAIAGNIIDYGAKNALDIEKEIQKIIKAEENTLRKENKAVFNFGVFIKKLKKSKNILYLADNAGETVFDRFLLEEIKELFPKSKIFYAVKEKPIINDALKQDAVSSGIRGTAEIISSGSDAPGTVMSLCSKDFKKLFYKADMIISKGQGNFEALSKNRRDIFFLLKIKCKVVAQHMVSMGLKCNIADIALFYKRKGSEK